MEKIGGLYIKKDKNDQEYFQGKIRDEKVFIFKNKRKEKETHPDYNVMVPDSNDTQL